jgi:hyperosmotically inducible protein
MQQHISCLYILFISLLFLIPVHSASARTLTDEAITVEVEKLLLREKDVPHSKIKVTTKKGIVELSGFVDTRLQANKITELAASVTDVMDVRTDNLEIKSSKEFLSDAYITAKAKGKIKYLAISGKIKSDYNLHLETTNGIVHIFGDVINESDIKTIKEAILDIIDVNNVKINIKCKQVS